MANAFNGNGQSAEVRLEVTPSQTAKRADVHVDLDVGELSAADVNIVFAFDASGSLGATAYAQQLNAIQTAINDLRTQFDDASNSVQIKLLRFASGVSDFPDGRTTAFDLDDAALDDVLALAPFTGGQANYLATLRAANNFFDAQADGDQNFLIFSSDGNPFPSSANRGFENVAAEIQTKASVSAFGIGSNIALNILSLLDNTGGAELVQSASDLTSAIATTPIFPLDVVSFTLTLNVDGAGPQIIATEANLTADGSNFDIDLSDVAGLARGNLNVFTATAVFDVDGDQQTTDDQVTLSQAQTVAGANAAPATSGTVTANGIENGEDFTVNLLEGASDGDGDSLTVSGLTLRAGDDAGVTISGTTLLLNPDAYDSLAANTAETIIYDYVIKDGFGGSTNQSARITIAGRNDDPSAKDDTITGDEDTAITGNVLADNGAGADSDIDSDALTVGTTPVSDVANGTLTLNVNGAFTYIPDANFTGGDSFTYSTP